MIDEDNWVKREATEAPPHIQCSRLLLSRWCMAALTWGCVGAPPLIFRGSKWCWGREGGSWRHRCRNFAKLIASLFLAHFHFHRVCGPFLFQRRLLSSPFFSWSTCFLVEILLSVKFTDVNIVTFSVLLGGCCVAPSPLYLLESGRMFFGSAISSQPQETTRCQKRRWRGGEGAPVASIKKIRTTKSRTKTISKQGGHEHCSLSSGLVESPSVAHPSLVVSSLHQGLQLSPWCGRF